VGRLQPAQQERHPLAVAQALGASKSIQVTPSTLAYVVLDPVNEVHDAVDALLVADAEAG
jgi:hypothetical protein